MYSNYGNTNVSDPALFEGLLAGASIAVVIVFVLLMLIVLAAVILVIVSNCKLFKKAGEAWWKALIPLYNSWIETRITGLAWWWFLIFTGIAVLTSLETTATSVFGMALVLVSFNYNYNLAKKFGKSNGFAVLNTLLPVVGLPILAFGSAKYNKDAKVDQNGIFSVK